MRKAIYSIGILLTSLFLIVGFYMSYRVADIYEKIESLGETVRNMETEKVDTLAHTLQKDMLYTFEVYDAVTNELIQEQYQLISYSTDNIVFRQMKESESSFMLKESDGYVVVYQEDGKSVYEHTDIAVENLSEDLQKEILGGKIIESTEELYSFLENYSS